MCMPNENQDKPSLIILFRSKLTSQAGEDYQAMNAVMETLLRRNPGFVDVKSYTAADGETIAVVRLESRAALDAWKLEPRHRRAQELGREAFYEQYWVQASETFRSYRFTRASGYGEIPSDVFLVGARQPATASDRSC